MSMINCSCNCNCTCRCRCAVLALVLSAIIGVLTAFLQVTGVITVTDTFLWVALGVAVVYLAVLVASTARCGCPDVGRCRCTSLNTALAGILGTALLSLVLLAVGIVATSVVNALLLGALLFFFTLILTSTACYLKAVADCDD